MGRAFKKDVGAIVHNSGVSFRVWAPFAKALAVTGSFNNWSKTPMESEGDGYWAVVIKEAQAGQEYKYVIDTGSSELYKNDPRAKQVTTASGNSVITDPAYDWSVIDFQAPSTNTQVLYEMHIGTFFREDPATTGSFHTAIEKLDYLAELGVTTLQLMPVASMPDDRGWGYATNYIYAVESLYGGHRAFQQFIDAAHKRGMAVVLDVVYNHFGPGGNLDIWQFDGWSQDGKGGIYFYNDWRSSTPWGDTRPDYGRREVQQYILDNVRMWMQDFQLDGLRLDSTIYVRNVKGQNDDPSNDLSDGWVVLQEVNQLARKINPDAITIAEDIGANEYLVKSRGEGGADFSAQWEVNFPRALRDVLDVQNDNDRDIQKIYNFLLRKYAGDSFKRVVYSDSHDSAANGASRLNQEISPKDPTSIYARQRSLLAAGVVLTMPGIPMLFQGQEFLQGGSFNDWQALDWDNSEQFSGIVEAHKHLIALRKNAHGNTAGLCGQFVDIAHMSNENKVLAWHRWDKGGPRDDVVIMANFTNRKLKDFGITFPRDGVWLVRFDSSWEGYNPDFKSRTHPEIQVQGQSGSLNVAPYTIVVLSQDD